MGLNINVFQEPRGAMRIIQFIFAIWAFTKTVDYTNQVTLNYCTPAKVTTIEFGYPFKLDTIRVKLKPCSEDKPETLFSLVGDFSSDAQFYVATGVLSVLYCVGATALYVLFDSSYESNTLVPMADFLITLVLAVFWLSGSAAWANGLLGLKSITSPENIVSLKSCTGLSCSASVGSFSGLNISVTLGFLNFFLWAFDLWFLYKETQWFKNATQTAVPSGRGVAAT